jgi:E3 ubiquitin-protein ligase HUWE1
VADGLKKPLAELPSHLKSFDFHWPYPRGDLYHWIPLLDLFDTILEEFVREYGLQDGPQTQHFGTTLLLRGVVGPGESSCNRSSTAVTLTELAFSIDGDRELVESVLAFSQLLQDNCGNRSLYASSERLGHLLNTTSLTLLFSTLQLASRLAIRYYHARQRSSGANQHINPSMLANHYNIDLDHVQKLADLSRKNSPSLVGEPSSASDSSANRKGKSASIKDLSPDRNDLLAAVRADAVATWEIDGSLLTRWSTLTFPYQSGVQGTHENDQPASGSADDARDSSMPSTPTPLRRTPGLPLPGNDGSAEGPIDLAGIKSTHKVAPLSVDGLHTLHIPSSELMGISLEEQLQRRLHNVPIASHFDFFNHLRTAFYMTKTLETRRMMVATRILALTNLAYIYPEAVFQQKLLKNDSEEPRRLQLVQQLVELIHPQNNDQADIPLYMKTIAIGALEALSKHKARAHDVSTALSISVNHGILLFVIRKTVADLANEMDSLRFVDWQEALLSLIETLSSVVHRGADSLVAAGLLEVLVDVLKLRSTRAERLHHKILMYLSSIVINVRDAFQAFVNAKGLETVSELIAWEVSTSIVHVGKGSGFEARYKSQVIDYKMPYFQQQTLRWLLKFVNHIMTNGSANFDRLLRNLIDSPPLLEGLRSVLANGKIFGSTIWSGAVNILSSFIHNEPTSYAVIAEAGLSNSFLESMAPSMAELTEDQGSTNEAALSTIVRKHLTPGMVFVEKQGVGHEKEVSDVLDLSKSSSPGAVQGILPATDAISAIPSAFGAICLNTNGLDMFLASGALETFFEIFQSPEHAKVMAAEANLPKNLGQHFDELVRHHPRLKAAVMRSVVLMCARLSYYCSRPEVVQGSGATLYSDEESQGPGRGASGQAPTEQKQDDDTIMADELFPSASPLVSQEKHEGDLTPSVSSYIGIVAKFLSGFFDNQSLCHGFITGGGLEFLLDLTTCKSLPFNFSNQAESQDLAQVLHLLIDYKPHLTLPALVTRALDTMDVLEPLTRHNHHTTFFSSFTSPPDPKYLLSQSLASQGTSILRGLVGIHTLCNVLQEAFVQVYSTRSHHTPFSQVNLVDVYVPLVISLGKLYRVCVWEEIMLQNTLTEDLKESTRVNGYGMGSDEADEVFGFLNHEQGEQGNGGEDTSIASAQGNLNEHLHDGRQATSGRPQKSAYRKNIVSLRFLLSQVPSSITPLLQGLGRSLVSKRRVDPYLRQNAYRVADTLAEVALDHLEYGLPQDWVGSRDRFAYWIVALTSLSQLLIEGMQPHATWISYAYLHRACRTAAFAVPDSCPTTISQSWWT